ncbi:nascent polypeptide-associated complex subunit alpha, muscle-specific form-like [Stegostoma tigrinum]|uniref:nascent polypeptide-associated complex subunit alpha, muscle-specific form-like n=1 Tax=Stegostoma tigrinum TaxID=3053191 RepID=UPI00202ADEC4|nr:nascent polypeptide-associated complex subunit alpha, muscle-specific form-like [Stegostoma tigrinum]
MDPRLRAVRASRRCESQGPAARPLDFSLLLGRCLRLGETAVDKGPLSATLTTRRGWRGSVRCVRASTPAGARSLPQEPGDVRGKAAANSPTPSGQPGPRRVQTITVDLRAALARVREPPEAAEEIGDPPSEGDTAAPGPPTPEACPPPPSPQAHKAGPPPPEECPPPRQAGPPPPKAGPPPPKADPSESDPPKGDPSPGSTLTVDKPKRQRRVEPRAGPARRDGLWKMKVSLPALKAPGQRVAAPLRLPQGTPHGAGATADHRVPPADKPFVSFPKLLRTSSGWSSPTERRSPDRQTKRTDPSFVNSVEESAIPFHQLLHLMRKRTSSVNHVLITEVLKCLREDLWSVPEEQEHSHLNYLHAQHFRRGVPFQRTENRTEVKSKCTWQARDQFGNNLPVRISLFTDRSL